MVLLLRFVVVWVVWAELAVDWVVRMVLIVLNESDEGR